MTSDNRITWTRADLVTHIASLPRDAIILLPGDDLVGAVIEVTNDGTYFVELQGRKAAPKRT